MGWWSTEINGGDTSMDVEGVLASFMGLDEEADDYDGIVESGELTTDVVRSFLSAKCDDNGHGFAGRMIENGEGSILYTVLGALLMEAGTEIPEDFRTEIIQQACLDRWADTNEERKVVIEEFIETLENYVDGTPTDLARGAFFDRAAKPDYIGAKPSVPMSILPLADLMPRIGAILITNLTTPAHAPTMWNVVGYERGRLIGRCQHHEKLFNIDDIRDYINSSVVDIRLFELNELTVIGV